MPTSAYDTIAPMIYYMQHANPRSILDVGSGSGKYGVLAREYLEIWQGRTLPDQWIIQIDAVEIWEPYAAYPAYEKYYDHFYNANIVDFIKDMDRYDLIICGDVLEHLDKSQAWKVFHALLKRCPYMIVSIPLGLWPVANVGENIYEDHIGVWDDNDVALLPIIKSQFVQAPNRILVALLRGEG